MADKRIQDLPGASSVQTNDLFVLEQSGAAMSLSGQTLITDLAAYLDGHGGISDITYSAPISPSLNGTLTITMADATTYSVTIANGNGIEGIAIAYGISSQGTTPAYVSSWASTPTAPTDANPYQWTRIRITDKTGAVTDAYSVSMKAVNPTMSIGFVSAETGANADATVTNSGTPYNPVFDFDFTLPKGDKGDTGDYIDPVLSYGTSTAANTEPTTWYSSPSSLSYTAGNFIWQKTEYVLHDAQTVQRTVTKAIGYIGLNGSGSGTVTQITFNGDVFSDDGTGNVTMTVDAEDVGAIADPANKSNGQVLTYDSTADEWVAATPSTGSVNTVNNVGVTAGTTNIALTGSNIPVSSSDSTTIDNAIPQASATTPAALGTAAVGSGTTWARADHVHPMPSAANVGAVAVNGSSQVINPVSDLNSFVTGVALFSEATANLPSNNYGDWWLVVAGGSSGTTAQTAYHLWNVSTPKQRYLSGGTWSAWADLYDAAVRYITQTLSAAQKAQARNNIGSPPADWTAVWTNSSPGSNFGEQTVSLDLSAYREFVIEVNGSTSASGQTNKMTQYCLQNGTVLITFFNQIGSASVMTLAQRRVTISPTGITFGEASSKQFTATTAASTSTSLVIPAVIYAR